MTHLAIDLGETNQMSEAILFHPQRPQEQRYLRFATKHDQLKQVVRDREVRTVIIEACRTAHWVCPLLQDLGVEVIVANTGTEDFQTNKRRPKTDREDAIRLMRLFLDGRLKPIALRSARAMEQQAQLNVRRMVVAELTSYKSQIRSVLDCVGITCPPGKKAWTKKGLAGLRRWCETPPEPVAPGWWQRHLQCLLDRIEARMAELRACDRAIAELRQADAHAEHLTTIPGIGDINAVALAASIDRPERFRDSKQVSRYSGFDPVPYESGKRKGTIGISRGSNAAMRGYLYEACNIAVCRLKEPWFVLQYQRLLQTGKPRPKVLCAIARRLYVLCWRMLKTGCSWTEVTAHSLAAAGR